LEVAITINPVPVAIIGAGPVGLAAAAHLVERDLPFVLLEAGSHVGANALAWGHVQMFSPWRYNIDRAAARLLEQSDWLAPDPEAYPTGRDLVEQYLAPLAAHPAIAPYLRLGVRVAAVTRVGLDKMKDAGRAVAPFALHLMNADGSEDVLHAAAVIDASGTYQTPNPLGAGGVPAPGERALADSIFYGIPDVLGADRARYAGRRVLVAGSGHSAFNAVLDLATVAEEFPDTTITWAIRRRDGSSSRLYGGGANDALPARGALGSRVQALVEAGKIRFVTGWQTDRLRRTAAGIVVAAGDRTLPPVDEIVVATGLRPDLAMLGELRLGLDPAVEAPAPLAPLIDPNVHSCGTVRPHGVDELAHPESGFFMIGMKSYGRAPTFLLATGYEQARSVVAALAGDWEAARRVELELPETGVCSGPGSADADGAACCGADAPVEALQIEVTSGAAGGGSAAGFRSLIDLTPAVVAVGAAASCCAPAAQATCCAPEEKGACCGVAAGEPAGASCGCQ
jgi:thioredoxin reductase